jgi:hypothetical protein
VVQTGKKLEDRMEEHLYNMYHKKRSLAPHSIPLPGHSHLNFKVHIIEKYVPNIPSYRLEKEVFWIKH